MFIPRNGNWVAEQGLSPAECEIIPSASVCVCVSLAGCCEAQRGRPEMQTLSVNALLVFLSTYYGPGPVLAPVEK